MWLCLPDRVVTIDDDYGYLRSVQETWEKGRPWTNEFLVPFAATTSLLTCLLYAVSGGSMMVGVHGALALSAAVFYGGLAALVRMAGVSRWLAALVSFLVLTGPTVFFMLLMFTSVPLYWAGLVICVVAGVKRNWWLFSVAFVLSIATRQSALVWLAIPGWLLVEEVWAGRKQWPKLSFSWGPVLAIGVGLAAFVLLKLGMNETNGQRVADEAMRQMPGGGVKSFLGVFAILAGYGTASFLLGMGRGEVVRRVMWVPAVLVGAAGAWLAIWSFEQLTWSHSCYLDGWTKPVFGMMGTVAGLGLILFPRLPWWPALWAGLGAWLPQLIYVSGFDYYYVETFLWGLVASLFGTVAWKAKGAGWLESGLVRGLGVLVALALVGWNLRCVAKHKLSQDRVSAFCQVYEKALDEGLLKPHEVGFSPFGYTGWLFDEYYLAGGGRSPGAFVSYRDDWNGERGTGVLSIYPREFRKYRDWLPAQSSKTLRESPDAVLVTSIDAKILWFWKAKFEIRRVHSDAKRDDVVELDYDRYVRQPFPLNDEEWRKLMAGDRTLGRSLK